MSQQTLQIVTWAVDSLFVPLAVGIFLIYCERHTSNKKTLSDMSKKRINFVGYEQNLISFFG